MPGREVKQNDSSGLQAGAQRHTTSTHSLYFHLAPGKFRLSRHLDLTLFGWFALKKRDKNDHSDKMLFNILLKERTDISGEVYSDLTNTHTHTHEELVELVL